MNIQPIRLFNIYGENKGTGFAGNVWDVNTISPTLTTMGGGNRQPLILTKGGNTEVKVDIQKIDIPQTVKVRKYPIDTKKLCECLRNHKNDSGLTNKDIAEMLRIPITKVEHWFRQDDCFAIPDAEIWFQLKTILDISTDEFDVAVTTFEEKEGVYEKSERHYFSEGLSPTLTCMSGNEKILVSQNLPLALDEQNKYIRTDGTVGTIMTDGSSPKHNNRVIVGGTQKHQAVKKDGVCTCLTSSMGTGGGYVPMHNYTTDYRIRKLTPKECWRLMGFDDADFDKAEKVCSNTQLYKQAGNSIVVNVLEGILGNLLPKQSRSEWLDELLGV